ncbi:TPR domain protein [Fusarium sp. NRRL 52700]|nr:TPR domain protein [Fusarium sp. NRRL 52700]
MTSSETSFLTQDLAKYRNLVLDELTELEEFTGPSQVPRIWWIGTGITSSLPFYAASRYLENPEEDTLRQVVSSYTPTVKSLVHARSCTTQLDSKKDKKPEILVVSMPDTQGQKALPGVTRECAIIIQTLGDGFTVKQLEKPSIKQVQEVIQESDIVHFACHRFSDHMDPSNSHLLHGVPPPEMPGFSEASDQPNHSKPLVGRLTAQEISNNHVLGKAQIAYLSACSTAEVKAEKFPGAALHIASAFQVAGFGHMIGLLWSTDDNTCVEMAKFFFCTFLKKKIAV